MEADYMEETKNILFRNILNNILKEKGLGPLDLIKESGLKEPDDKCLIMYINGKRDTFPLAKMEKIFEKFVDFEVKK